MSADAALEALRTTEQAIADLCKGHAELAKLGPGGLTSAATFTKMIGQLDTIRASLAVLEAHQRAHPQHRSTQ